MKPTIAKRAGRVQPFHVMELVKRAIALEASGRSIIHMSIGEPDFKAPATVLAALQAAAGRGDSGYTPAVGIVPLREAISRHYAGRFGVDVDPGRIVITAGASAALLLAFAALLERDTEVLMPDPSYPCNRHFASVLEGGARLVPSGPAERFQLSAHSVAEHWTPATRGVLLASPSNPTGTTIAAAELARIIEAVRARGGFTIVDEIYQGLRYDSEPETALALADDVIVINSFSKYFSMTGWRLGWLVAPAELVPVIEKLAQNLFSCPGALSQHAAIACFDPESIAIYEDRRAEFRRRRDFIVPALRGIGFDIPVMPDGAFYVYADVSKLSPDSSALADDMLDRAGVCAVPGMDFGNNQPHRWMRFSYATSMENLEQAVERIDRTLRG
jgi:aspartate/methionine/tyrosine aminotransferase